MSMPRRLPDAASPVPLFDTATSRRIEQRAASGLPEHELMTRAGLALARLARALAPHARKVWIAAGPGNNGGDGLVLATLMHEAGVDVRVTLVGQAGARALPPDAAWALAQARAAGVALLHELPAEATLAGVDLGVDALFGLGQQRAPEGLFALAIAALNRLRAPVLAVDLPTGLASDTGVILGASIVRAAHTLVLLTPKPGLFTAAGREVAGDVWFADLGVEPGADALPSAMLTGESQAAALYPARRHFAHKGSFGDVRIVGGAAGMVGASLLAGHAASVAGAGRVLVHARSSKEGGALPVDVRHPELMLRPLSELGSALRDDGRATVVAGCGGGEDVAAELPGCLSNACRLVLDADALNAIARDAGLRAQLRRRGERGLPTILTPHPLEAARLLQVGVEQLQADRLAAARRLAADTGAVVVLKGSGTIIATPEGAATINPTGDARLATAGTGDVLAGWIGGSWAAQAHAAHGSDTTPADVIAQAGALAARIAIAAVFVHGRACDFAPGTRLPLVASDLIVALARATEALQG